MRAHVTASQSRHRFRGVAVITSALHAEGPQFDPGRNHVDGTGVNVFAKSPHYVRRLLIPLPRSSGNSDRCLQHGEDGKETVSAK